MVEKAEKKDMWEEQQVWNAYELELSQKITNKICPDCFSHLVHDGAYRCNFCGVIFLDDSMEKLTWTSELNDILHDFLDSVNSFLIKMGFPYDKGLKTIIAEKSEYPNLFERTMEIVKAKLGMIVPKHALKDDSYFKGKVLPLYRHLLKELFGLEV